MINQSSFGLPEFNRSPISFAFNGTFRATTEKSTVLNGYYGTNSKVAAVFTNAILSIGSSVDNVALKKNVESFLSAFAEELDYLENRSRGR